MSEIKKMEVTDDNEKPRLKMCILFDLGFGLTIQETIS